MRRTLYAGRWARLALAFSLVVAQTGSALAHGFAGDRFFPATILTDDPFVADEISLPQVTVNPPGPDGAKETDIQIDLSKRITPNFGITIGDQWQRLKPSGLPALSGLGPLETGAQYQLFVDGPRQAIGLVGLDVTWAHTGRAAVGAPDFTTLSPTFAFGKGFGDLPEIVDLAAAVGDHRQFERRLPDQDTKRWNGKPKLLQLWFCVPIQP